MKNITKLFLTVFLFVLATINAMAQLEIQWKHSYGGSKWDQFHGIQQTTDGGYITAAFSLSTDGDFTENQLHSFLVTKLDALGNIELLKSLVGSGGGMASSIQQTMDGGFVVMGTTNSGNYGVVKIDAVGNIQWQKSLGGSRQDHGSIIQQTTDGGFIVGGSSQSNDGDVSGNHGNSDYWVVKLDAIGSIQWQKSLGGSSSEFLGNIQQTMDGGFIVSGSSESNDGDVTGNHGDSDYWVVKLDAIGSIQWQKSLGGSGHEGAANVQQTTDVGYILAGQSRSNDGDVSGNHGGTDCWVVKLDAGGSIQWQKSLGGSGSDVGRRIQQTIDDGFIVGVHSESNDGDVSGNHGGYDWWLVKLDASGNIQWQGSLGGSEDEVLIGLDLTQDGGFVIAGRSKSSDGDVSSNNGDFDSWIVKLKCPLTITCQGDVTVPSDPGTCGASVAFNAPSESGNCTGVGVNQTAGPESGSVFPVGTTTVSFLATDATGSTASCSFTVTVTSDLTADAGSDQVVIIDNGPGPDPYPCDTLKGTASGGTGPFTYSWSPTDGLSDPNSANTDVCPTVTTTYTLSVTDANGCESTDEVTVIVIDIDDTGSLPLVGNNPNKVYVCHLATCTTVEANIQANCNSPNSLCAHLVHGDVLGECTCKNGSGEGEPHVHDWNSQLNAYPNPFTNTTTLTFRVEQDCRATLSVFDITGKEVARPFDGAARKGKLHIATLDGTGLGSGIYFYTLQTDYGESFTKTLVLSR